MTRAQAVVWMTPSEWSMLRRLTRTFSGAATAAAGGSPSTVYEVEAVSQAVVTAAAVMHGRREAARRAGASSVSAVRDGGGATDAETDFGGDADGATVSFAGGEPAAHPSAAARRPRPRPKTQDPSYWTGTRDDLLPPGGVIE
jgi:hypothetical protein